MAIWLTLYFTWIIRIFSDMGGTSLSAQPQDHLPCWPIGGFFSRRKSYQYLSKHLLSIHFLPRWPQKPRWGMVSGERIVTKLLRGSNERHYKLNMRVVLQWNLSNKVLEKLWTPKTKHHFSCSCTILSYFSAGCSAERIAWKWLKYKVPSKSGNMTYWYNKWHRHIKKRKKKLYIDGIFLISGTK